MCAHTHTHKYIEGRVIECNDICDSEYGHNNSGARFKYLNLLSVNGFPHHHIDTMQIRANSLVTCKQSTTTNSYARAREGSCKDAK